MTISPTQETAQHPINPAELDFHLLNVPPDGDCFFHCMSLALIGDFSHTSLYRVQICRFVYDSWDDYKPIAEASHDIGSVNNKYAYWTRMATTREYATQCEIQAASALFKCNITVWLQCHENGRHRYIKNCFFGDEQANTQINLLLSGNHFQVMLFDVVTAHGNEQVSGSHSSPQHYKTQLNWKKRRHEQEMDFQDRCNKLKFAEYIPRKKMRPV